LPRAASKQPSSGRRQGFYASAPEKVDEFFGAQSGVGDNSPKRARPNVSMIRHDHASMRMVAPQNHVAAILTPEHETSTLQRCANFSAG
jgi:hypothetical protein